MKAAVRAQLIPVNLRTWNPRGCLVAAFDDQAGAWQAVTALHQAGFASDAVHLAAAQEVIASGETPPACSLLTRMVQQVRSYGDESIVAARYLDEAREGHPLLVIAAERGESRQQAYALLRRHRAHTIMYFGRWIITDHV